MKCTTLDVREAHAAITNNTTASQAFDVIWTATDAGTAISCTCFRLWEVC